MGLLEVRRVKINVEVTGSGQALALFHGFTGSAESWSPFIDTLSRDFRTICIDALGHGKSDSPFDSSRYNMENVVADFVAILDLMKIDKVALLGYSMGGRMALNIATTVPERVGALILESATPGLVDEQSRTDRILADFILADFIEQAGVPAFVTRWEKLPLFASQGALPEEVLERQRNQRLNNKPQGLANSLRGAGTGSMSNLHFKLASLKMPTLVIAGGFDKKFCNIAQEMKNMITNSSLAIVEEAGHTVHLEKPAIFEKLVTDFLRDKYLIKKGE